MIQGALTDPRRTHLEQSLEESRGTVWRTVEQLLSLLGSHLKVCLPRNDARKVDHAFVRARSGNPLRSRSSGIDFGLHDAQASPGVWHS